MAHRLCIVIVPALAALAVAVGGCGSQEAAARARLVAQADPICKQVYASRLAANATLPNSLTVTLGALQALARVAPGVAAYQHQAVDRLRTLKAPASLAHAWQEMLAGMQQLADDTTQLGLDAKAKDIKDTQLVISSGRALRKRLTVIAARDGFAYCGRTS